MRQLRRGIWLRRCSVYQQLRAPLVIALPRRVYALLRAVRDGMPYAHYAKRRAREVAQKIATILRYA